MKDRKPDDPKYQSRDTCQKCGSSKNVISVGQHRYAFKVNPNSDDWHDDIKCIRFTLKCVPCDNRFVRDFEIGTVSFLEEIENEQRRIDNEAKPRPTKSGDDSKDYIF